MSARVYGSDYFQEFRSRLGHIPLQALILFTPVDEPMITMVRRHGDRIQAVTGDHVVALVPIDIATRSTRRRSDVSPPSVARSAGAWALLDQFVSLGGARWDELPALVVGRSALTGSRLVIPTAPAEILSQLEAVANVVRDSTPSAWLQQIRRRISNLSTRARFAPRAVRTITRRETIDGILGSLAGAVAYGQPPQLDVSYMKVVFKDAPPISEPEQARLALREKALSTEPRSFATSAAVSAIATPHQLPATVEAVWSQLDDAGRAFLSTAVVVSDALSASTLVLDYAAAAAPLCKLFERQLNLAPVQVARQCRGVPLPERYIIFDPDLSAGSGLVNTDTNDGQRRHVNINQLDPLSPSRGHQFLTVGEAHHLLRVMERDPALRAGLDAERVSHLKETARRIGAIRNQVVAHSRPMPLAAFEHLRTLILESGTIEHLAGLAASLRT
jgi:hypothetical protein